MCIVSRGEGWARWGCCWPTGQMDSRGQLATLGA